MEKLKIDSNLLRDLYLEDGASIHQLALRFSCSERTITGRMKKWAIQARKLKRVSVKKQTLINLYFKRGLSLKKIGDQLGLSPSGVLKKTKKYGLKLRSSWENNTIYPKQPFSGSKKEKAYLVGFRLGDLGVSLKSKNTGTVWIKSNTTRIEQVELINNIFSRYSHLWISKSNNRNVYHVSAYLDKSFSFLIPKQDNVENWILNNNDCMDTFIAGYTDAEGSIKIYDGRARFRIGSCDKKILAQISRYLTEKGIRFSLLLEKEKNKNLNKDFWRLNISDVSSLKRIFQMLSPHLKHRGRKEDVKQAMINLKSRYSYQTAQIRYV